MNEPSESSPPRDLFVGRLERDFFITEEGQTLLDVPGGNALYSAVGYRVWERDLKPGLLARVGENYPQAWLNQLRSRGVDVQGVKILAHSLDARRFYSLEEDGRSGLEHPMAHFSRVGNELPSALIGYEPPEGESLNRRNLSEVSLRQEDLPRPYLAATAAHLSPVDFLTHHLLPSVFRQAGFTTVTLDPCSKYMDPNFFPDIPALVTGLTAFLPGEVDLRSLYKRRKADLWEMAAEIASFGCSLVVIRGSEGGQLLYIRESGQRWKVPAYPGRSVKLVGDRDAFCGGFLAGYRKTFDPLEAVLHGSVSASLVREGLDPFYALEAMERLPEARLNFLRGEAQQV